MMFMDDFILCPFNYHPALVKFFAPLHTLSMVQVTSKYVHNQRRGLGPLGVVKRKAFGVLSGKRVAVALGAIKFGSSPTRTGTESRSSPIVLFSSEWQS